MNSLADSTVRFFGACEKFGDLGRVEVVKYAKPRHGYPLP
jgi:hypothetical protein